MPQSVSAIDVHSHVVTAEVLAVLEAEGEHYQTRIVERDGQRLFLVEETATRPINDKILGSRAGEARLVDMDAQGIEREVLSCVPFVMYPGVAAERGLYIAQVHNDSVAALAASRPERFMGMASVPLQAPGLAARELERAAGRGLIGVMIPPHVRGRTLDDSDFEPVWDAAEALNMPVFIHPFEAAPTGLLARYNLGNLAGNLVDTGFAAAAIVCSGVLERHPRLRVLLAHTGGTLPVLIGRIDSGYPRSAANVSRLPSSFMNQLWLDSIAFNRPLLRSLIELFGAERFVVGSDYPVGGPARPVEEVTSLGLAAPDEEAILRGNALRLLRG